MLHPRVFASLAKELAGTGAEEGFRAALAMYTAYWERAEVLGETVIRGGYEATLSAISRTMISIYHRHKQR